MSGNGDDRIYAEAVADGRVGSGTNSLEFSYSYCRFRRTQKDSQWEGPHDASEEPTCVARVTYHVEGDDATLPHNARDVVALRKLLQDGEAIARRDAAERLGRFVSDHVFLVRSSEDLDQGRDGIGR